MCACKCTRSYLVCPCGCIIYAAIRTSHHLGWFSIWKMQYWHLRRATSRCSIAVVPNRCEGWELDFEILRHLIFEIRHVFFFPRRAPPRGDPPRRNWNMNLHFSFTHTRDLRRLISLLSMRRSEDEQAPRLQSAVGCVIYYHLSTPVTYIILQSVHVAVSCATLFLNRPLWLDYVKNKGLLSTLSDHFIRYCTPVHHIVNENI